VAAAVADLQQAINSVWDSSTLDATFTGLWSNAALSSEFPVLNDQEALGAQPFPYVVMDSFSPVTDVRMSSEVDELREVRDVEVVFNVHAREISGDSRTPKEIAAFLAEEIMKVFGGHPTVSPTGTLTLTNGNHLITTYQNDMGIRTGDDEYMWRVVYVFKLDVTVAI
jgi:hypothetical protein